jgi:hypothetical protein
VSEIEDEWLHSEILVKKWCEVFTDLKANNVPHANMKSVYNL